MPGRRSSPKRSARRTHDANGARGRPLPADAAGEDLALRRRVVIEGVRPEVNCGRFPAKATLGEPVIVEANVFADGQEAVACDVLFRAGEGQWQRTPMRPLGNDRWRAEFPIDELTDHYFTIEAWTDPFARWHSDLQERIAAGQDVSADLQIGAEIVREAASRASGADAKTLTAAAARLSGNGRRSTTAANALNDKLAALMREHADRSTAVRYAREVRLTVDVPKAGFSAWYEMFPRSASPDPKRAGTFADVEARLPYVAGMGFDVLYLPPVHPIGSTHRKGKNNATEARRGEPGSPWAIGSPAGGHKAVAPELGTLADFRRLVARAKELGLDVALDIAFQCSPDHPYLTEHPQWFRHRPDGSVQYAENPPKKYEDILPFDFDTPDWRALWDELKSVFTFWIEQGVNIFRVDNPHTKPFRFWEWLIAEVRRQQPDVIFLSEAFTRPSLMYHLAKLGFTQSYTYFTWRNTKWELTEYFRELTEGPPRDFFRPNAWPNTPDILHEYVQRGGRAALIARLVLAATLSANYGIYGPAFELGERTPREPGSEEYLDSEKYELKHWDLERPDSLRQIITLVNRARRDNPALQGNRGLRFHDIENPQLLCYSKQTADAGNIVITVVNLDSTYRQAGWLHLPVEEWGLRPDEAYQVHDLLGGARYRWTGGRNYVELDPQVMPAHIFRLRRHRGSSWEFQ